MNYSSQKWTSQNIKNWIELPKSNGIKVDFILNKSFNIPILYAVIRFIQFSMTPWKI